MLRKRTMMSQGVRGSDMNASATGKIFTTPMNPTTVISPLDASEFTSFDEDQYGGYKKARL